MQTEILSHDIRNHRDMSTERLSGIAHVAFATRNRIDNSRVLLSLSEGQAQCELQFARAHAALLNPLSERALRFHPVEPAVPGPLPEQASENREPAA
jgi:hypothetical protein